MRRIPSTSGGSTAVPFNVDEASPRYSIISDNLSLSGCAPRAIFFSSAAIVSKRAG